jgi:hypothetical protein
MSFLGEAGFYRKIFPHYAHISAALTDCLTKKHTKFAWSSEAEAAFLDIKSRLSSAPILRPPDFMRPFHLAVDASDVATSAVLFQSTDGTDHPICYFSRKLDVHQRRYSTVEKEALALLPAVRNFSVNFGQSSTCVYTDHNPLVFLNRMANHNAKLLRWSLELQQYNLTIRHIAGKRNILPDILSRPSTLV